MQPVGCAWLGLLGQEGFGPSDLGRGVLVPPPPRPILPVGGSTQAALVVLGAGTADPTFLPSPHSLSIGFQEASCVALSFQNLSCPPQAAPTHMPVTPIQLSGDALTQLATSPAGLPPTPAHPVYTHPWAPCLHTLQRSMSGRLMVRRPLLVTHVCFSNC